jgi:hypothetical protein
MKYFLHTLIAVGIIIFWDAQKSFAEIKIKFPSERAVFQRDKNNTATVYILGIYTRVIDRVEAKMTPINGGDLVDWTTIQSNVQGGSYSGSLQVHGGWYRLEIRGWKGDQLVDTQQLERVGVGEVFMVGGQSNGEGYFDHGSSRADDDRVSCIDYDNISNGNTDLPYPQFTHLEANSRISPRGQSSWSWGRLGDVLSRRLGVPILFYNVAWYGSAMKNWRESLNGGTTTSVYDSNAQFLPGGSPYSTMKSALKFYVPITGIRGVLWLQGEADNDINTSTDTYFNDLKTVIEKTRNDSGKNLSWMVSLTSYNSINGFDSQVIEGQKRVINSVSNVFEGPNTDAIQIPRVDGTHFQDAGLSLLGEAWGDKLNDDFFSRSEPFKGVKPLEIKITCGGNNTVNLSFNGDGYNSFSWNNGQNSNNIQVGNGSYRAYARDNAGNTIVSPEIEIYETIQPPQANISIQGSNPICRGNSSTLISSISDGIRWNTGQEGDRITINTAGDYNVSIKNVYGCESSSAKVSISIIDSPLPDKPTISASGATVFCDGGEVKLTSSSKVKSVWNNGSTDGTISVRSSGDFKVMALDDKGCYSPESDVQNVKVNPLPARPVISLNRSATFCANEEVVMTSSYDSGNTWSTNASSKSITVNTTGSYNLKQTDVNGCMSTSDAVNVKVNPLPPTPAITALRPATFCERDYTVLQSSDAYSYVWSNGSNNREIEVRESGDFTISSRDANGCTSIPSAALKVTRNPLPSRPVITADGPTTFCADLSVNLSSDTAPGYLWSNGATSKTINITTAGSFFVQKISEFNCFSDPSNSVGTQTLALPPSPSVRALGATVFCDGNSVNLVATNGDLFFWSNGVENDTVNILKSGEYAARIRDNAGCYSPYSDKIVVDAKPNPAKPDIIKTGIYTLQSQNNISAGKYIWKINSTVLQDTTAVIKANQTGAYTVSNSVVYSAALTCTSPFSEPFALFVDANDQFVAYPNPSTNGKIILETLQNLSNVNIQIIDLKGIVYKNFKVNSFKFPYSIDLSELSNGLYLIRLNSNGLNQVKKMVLVK